MTTKEERRLTEVLHGMIMERQRLLIREANYLRGLVGLPPVRSEDGVIGVTAPPPRNLPEVDSDPAPIPTPIALNYNRRERSGLVELGGAELAELSERVWRLGDDASAEERNERYERRERQGGR